MSSADKSVYYVAANSDLIIFICSFDMVHFGHANALRQVRTLANISCKMRTYQLRYKVLRI